MVDRLLASPHHGERWGRHWLDVARYAEDQAHTFAVKPRRQAWRYRDWVIAALNDDMPYDRFARLQIAGDMLADAPADAFVKFAGLGFFGLGAEYYRDGNCGPRRMPTSSTTRSTRSAAASWDSRSRAPAATTTSTTRSRRTTTTRSPASTRARS